MIAGGPLHKEAGASGYRNNLKNGRFCRCRILGSRLRRGPGPASAPGSLDWRRHPVSTRDTEKCPIARSWRGFYPVSFIAEGSCRVHGCWHRLNRPEYNLGLVEDAATQGSVPEVHGISGTCFLRSRFAPAFTLLRLGMALDVACASGKPRQTRSPAVPAECPERTDWCTVKGGHTTSPAHVLSVP